MGFSRQEYWSGQPFPFPEDLPYPEIEPTPFASPALASGFFTSELSNQYPLVSFLFFFFFHKLQHPEQTLKQRLVEYYVKKNKICPKMESRGGLFSPLPPP